MKHKYSFWSQYLNKFLTYSFVAMCTCAMQANLLAVNYTKNTANISQKNVAIGGIFSEQSHTQHISFKHKLTGNNLVEKINKQESQEEKEELRRRADQAARDAAAARQAAEDAQRDSSTVIYDDPYYYDDYYDDGPWLGFGFGGHYGHYGHGGRHHGGGHSGGHGGHHGGGHHK